MACNDVCAGKRTQSWLHVETFSPQTAHFNFWSEMFDLGLSAGSCYDYYFIFSKVFDCGLLLWLPCPVAEGNASLKKKKKKKLTKYSFSLRKFFYISLADSYYFFIHWYTTWTNCYFLISFQYWLSFETIALPYLLLFSSFPLLHRGESIAGGPSIWRMEMNGHQWKRRGGPSLHLGSVEKKRKKKAEKCLLAEILILHHFAKQSNLLAALFHMCIRMVTCKLEVRCLSYKQPFSWSWNAKSFSPVGFVVFYATLD